MNDRQTDDVRQALAATRAHLLAAREPGGFWRGRLSSSALSTAVAAIALRQEPVPPAASGGMASGSQFANCEFLRSGIQPPGAVTDARRWLAAHQNADGGWGDTPSSPSNLSTTLLAWCALAGAGSDQAAVIRAEERAGNWIAAKAGGTNPATLSSAILDAYGCDRTFSAPILTICALAGRLGDDPWAYVPQLPFVLSLLPGGLFRFMRLSVVSYALPALIAIGLVRHRLGPRGPFPGDWLRTAAAWPSLRVLRRCQPAHGGFLEAAPLNGFVAASLAAAGWRDHPVTRDCLGFLSQTVRPDGSWPIDTNLSVWLTTLAIDACADDDGLVADDCLPPGACDALRDWLLDRQFAQPHPFTHAAPGGWGWTDLPGAVPDADDTAGALLALYALNRGVAPSPRLRAAVEQGLRWLLDLQNSDGGLPTFCRGWGRLPFDRSCPDITAHMLRACDAWYETIDARMRPRLDQAMHLAVNYLEQAQQPDGSWLPLWFGNQHAPGQANPTYGTAQVVRALNAVAPGRLPRRDRLAVRGMEWLVAAQHADGGWGGAAGVAPSIEETSLAVMALAGGMDEAAERGVTWLIRRTGGGTHFEPAAIGLYFARLWYAEELYPVIFTVRALAAWRVSAGLSRR